MRQLHGRRGPGRRAQSRARAGDGGLAGLAVARQSLAVPQVASTIEFVASTVRQGLRALVSACFDEPVGRGVKHFGEADV